MGFRGTRPAPDEGPRPRRFSMTIRRFGRLTAILAGALTVAATTSAQAAKQTVTYAFWGGQEEYDLTKKLVSQFQGANPDIDIKLQQVDSNTYEQKLLVQIASGTGPDVMVIRDASSSFMARRGLFLDLNPLVKSTKMNTNVFDASTMKSYRLGAAQYGLPRSVTPDVVYFNKAMFDTAGLAYPKDTWTWADFLKTSQKLTKDLNGDGKIDQWGVFMVPWDALFLPIVYSFGGNLITSDGAKATLLQKDTLAAFEFANDLINKYHVAPPIKEANSYNWIEGFAQQKFAIIFQGRWATPIFIDAMTKAKSKFTFDVAPIPTGKLRKTVGYSDALGILKGSKNPEAAFKWIQFVTGDVGQTVLGGPASLVVPANKNIAKSLVSPGAQPENAQLFISEARYAFAPPQTPSFSALYEILNRNLNEAFLGLKPMRDALTKADKELDAMIKQANESLK